jgi:hypothetical protein
LPVRVLELRGNGSGDRIVLEEPQSEPDGEHANHREAPERVNVN